MDHIEYQLVKHIIDQSYEDISVESAACTKLFILDTIGVALAARRASGFHQIIRYATDKRSDSASVIWGEDRRTHPEQAALANGFLAHALDYDETFIPGALHNFAVVLPAAAAVVGSLNQADGRTFLAAVHLGVDIARRLSLGMKDGIHLGFWPSGFFCLFGATATVSKLMGFNDQLVHDALGVAYSYVSGNRQTLLDGSLSKRLQCGISAKSAVTSAQLAKHGITGPKRFLEGEFGFFNLYSSEGWETRELFEDPGEGRLEEGSIIKVYPCCSGAHGPIQATLELAQEYRLPISEIDRILVQVPPDVALQIGRPFQMGTNPQVNAQFNLSYLVASAFINKRLTLSELEEDTIRSRADVLQVASLITVKPGEVGGNNNPELPATVEIFMKDGSLHRRTAHRLVGSETYQDARSLCLDKFRDCLQYAGGSQLEGWAEKFTEETLRLEDQDDINSWMKMLGEGFPLA